MSKIKYHVWTEVDAKIILLVTIRKHGSKGIKARELRKETGFRKSFLYYRLDELEGEEFIETFKKPKIRGRFFKITEKGRDKLAILGHQEP